MAEQDRAQTAAQSEPPTSRWANIFFVAISPLVLAFTGWNLWLLATTGGLYIRFEGKVVPADFSLYFWVTLGFYILMFFVSLIVLLLFFGWLRGKLRRAPQGWAR